MPLADFRRSLYSACKDGASAGDLRPSFDGIRLSKWKDVVDGISKPKMG